MKRNGSIALAVCVLEVVLATAGSSLAQKTEEPKKSKPVVLDINGASAEDFDKLPGIGPELARRIVTYRKKHGPFRRVEDLLAIRGMGPKKWRAIRPQLSVGSGEVKSGVQD